MADSERDDPTTRRRRFEEVALGQMPSVYRIARSWVGRPEDASDVTQETFLRAYRTFASFVPGTNCRAWLLKILYSVLINRHRKSQREPAHVAMEGLEREVARSSDHREAEWATLRAAKLDTCASEVKRALDQLPESFRAAVLLVDVEELTYEEAAAVLDCPVGTLRSRLFRGRRQLFDALREYARREGYLKSGATE